MSDDTAAIYKLPYDKEVDKDIYEWLNSFPKSRKADAVRHALRYYIAASKSSGETFKMITSSSDSTYKPSPKPVLKDTSQSKEKKKPKLNLSNITKSQ
ncbi:hypothetical protein [Bacillus atrophaeus]|uniref:hypothetical protein n=1 Tax=Bacillus atrophaeus TaxID=1452 RepID=UPI00227E7C0F|nr:hypothetical protein [Bacillus atrophaeus]MCY7947931.1 hypothetical protein [Bacillus atrophaeus]MCY8098516.1 hypothetical protein [Bacillus atrophaeus]MCY9170047.1 hypothetical protein [Bacillus atrophaeus]MEC0740601.1 hypothetical protein [Bacillus atrophaeus]MEC0746963.1 hypothetical protein [Bacillus atrophaeus]